MEQIRIGVQMLKKPLMRVFSISMIAWLTNLSSTSMAQTSSCGGMISHPLVQDTAASVSRSLRQFSGVGNGRTAEETFYAFQGALVRKLRERTTGGDPPDLQGLPDDEIIALMKTSDFVSTNLTPSMALRCFAEFAPLYAAAQEAEVKNRREQDRADDEERHRIVSEQQRLAEADEQRRHKQIEFLETQKKRIQERREQQQKFEKQQRSINVEQRELEAADRRREAERIEEDMKKPDNMLRQVFRSYALTKRCYEERLGYEQIYISNPELSRAREAAKLLQNKIMKMGDSIDSDAAWNDSSRVAFQMRTNRDICQLALRSLDEAVQQHVPEQSGIKKDF